MGVAVTWLQRVVPTVAFVSAFAVCATAVAQEDRDCELLDWDDREARVAQIVDEETNAGIHYSESYGGCTPGGGDVCDATSCCHCYHIRDIWLDTEVQCRDRSRFDRASQKLGAPDRHLRRRGDTDRRGSDADALFESAVASRPLHILQIKQLSTCILNPDD